jgi:hypothetical protein
MLHTCSLVIDTKPCAHTIVHDVLMLAGVRVPCRFMVSKTLTSSGDLVEGIIANLEQGKKGEAFSDAVWNVVWPKSDLRLRTFMCFGMETLMGLDLLGTRRFFLTFFTLPKDIWSGFLSWNMTNARLARMAYLLFVTFPLEMRIQFFVTALPFMPSFILNFLSPDKNNFDSKPWGGLPELAKLNLSKKDDKDDHSGPGGRERGSMPPIPLPTKGYTRTEVEQAKSEMTALLGASLDEPRKPSALKDDRDWTRFQQQKVFTDQPPLKSVLAPLESGAELDVLVAGAGPAGLSLAAELAKQGLRVGVIAPDTSFTNNYGVWYDEFAELGLEGTLKNVYDDVLVWMDDRCPAGGSDLGRKYGQVSPREVSQEPCGWPSSTARDAPSDANVHKHTTALMVAAPPRAAGGPQAAARGAAAPLQRGGRALPRGAGEARGHRGRQRRLHRGVLGRLHRHGAARDDGHGAQPRQRRAVQPGADAVRLADGVRGGGSAACAPVPGGPSCVHGLQADGRRAGGRRQPAPRA